MTSDQQPTEPEGFVPYDDGQNRELIGAVTFDMPTVIRIAPGILLSLVIVLPMIVFAALLVFLTMRDQAYPLLLLAVLCLAVAVGAVMLIKWMTRPMAVTIDDERVTIINNGRRRVVEWSEVAGIEWWGGSWYPMPALKLHSQELVPIGRGDKRYAMVKDPVSGKRHVVMDRLLATHQAYQRRQLR
ncbi:PH domain-containing protein [Propionibacteriaceae bacterium Y1700]|uniref:PH domain-containing protein n=1 Tax=Microlunatus sp. Y1700 TaxID=3418487 RepID=UPI003DA6EB3A